MMFTPDEITLLVAHMKRHGVAELEICQGAKEIWLVVASGGRPDTGISSRGSVQTISAKAFGILKPIDGAPVVGAAVDAGDIIAIVAVGPLRRPVVSPVAGKLMKILGLQDQRVEYGTPLFEILAS